MKRFFGKLTIILTLLGALLPLSGYCTSLTYQYDSLNRLITVLYSDGTIISYVYDPAGNRLSRVIIRNGTALKGDVNGDEHVNLADAILVLQVSSGLNPVGIRSDIVRSGAEVSSNQRIGTEEVVYILQKVAGMR